VVKSAERCRELKSEKRVDFDLPNMHYPEGMIYIPHSRGKAVGCCSNNANGRKAMKR
jgi:hypothetical protein